MPSAQSRRILAFHAHPDDESSKGAATMAKYAAEGHEVLVVTATGGEQGSILNPAFAQALGDNELADIDIAHIRKQEMETAAEILGVSHQWMGYQDSGLPENPEEPLPDGCFALVDNDEIVQKLVQIIREFRPDVFITYDENGGYPHPDHIKVHVVSMLAVDSAADKKYHPELGATWDTPKIYYSHGFIKERYEAFAEYYQDKGLPHTLAEIADLELESLMHRVTTHVHAAEYFPQRDAALRAHATQVSEDGIFLAVPTHIQQALWPTEEFELVRSKMEITLPEDSLLTGLE